MPPLTSAPDISGTEAACPACGQIAAQVDGVCLHCAARLVDATRHRPAGTAALAARPAIPGWEVRDPLANGGKGLLWLVRREPAPGDAGEEAVAKVAAPPGGAEAEARLETEAEILATLDHPNILRLLDVATAGDGRLALILEQVSGCDLRRLLRAEKLAAGRAMDIFDKLCAALRHAHGRGIVHRDVKPSNILVDAAGTVKLADFGLARSRGGSGGFSPHTSAGDGLGTPYYLAPEMLRDAASADARADVYALGVLLYEMLSGTVPLGTFVPLSKKCGLDRGWDALIREALSQDPAGRIGSVAALHERAGALWRREQRRGAWRARRRAIGVAAAVLLSGAAGAYISGREGAPAPPPFARPESAAPGSPWENSLGMQFLPLPGHRILMGVHEVRRSEFSAYLAYERGLRPSYRPATPPRRRLGVLTADGWALRDEPGADDPGFPVTPEHPACGVFPNEAQFFCAWLTLREQAEGRLLPHQHYRLPTVEEWTAAAADLTASPGNWSGPEARDADWPPDREVHAAADPFPRSAPVGSFPPNALGFHDFGGNVSEIAISDDAQPPDDPAWRPNLVRLGGSWAEVPAAATRTEPGKSQRNKGQRVDAGFRCVLDLGREAAD
ncbi:MAG: bifunctional serine/threonine-protein kinase/formylglycine-generating enzyme family protein [Verrucomicrobiales bacterium]